MKKTRLDTLLTEKKLCESRSQAQALIIAGEVLVDDVPVTKPGSLVFTDAHLRVRTPPRYVSRGGLKLEKALQTYGDSLKDLVCLDVGASTGGFTDCLLQHGASKVYAIDVGYGQMHWKLQTDKRVVRIDRTNFRGMDIALIDSEIDFVVCDVSFISLTLIYPKIMEVVRRDNSCRGMILLIKPQFEVGPENIGKGGIVKNADAALDVVKNISELLARDWKSVEIIKSPITGADGNQEYLCIAKK